MRNEFTNSQIVPHSAFRIDEEVLDMRRALIAAMCLAALVLSGPGIGAQGDGGYKLVPNWPKLPPGMYFGLKNAPPPPAEREAQSRTRLQCPSTQRSLSTAPQR